MEDDYMIKKRIEDALNIKDWFDIGFVVHEYAFLGLPSDKLIMSKRFVKFANKSLGIWKQKIILWDKDEFHIHDPDWLKMKHSVLESLESFCIRTR